MNKLVKIFLKNVFDANNKSNLCMNYSIPNLKNACKVMMYIAQEPRALTCLEIPRNLNIARTTTLRIVETLTSEGFLAKTENRQYKLGTNLATITGVVMLIVGASTAMSWIMTMTNIPQQIAQAMDIFGGNKIAVLMAINIILLFVGMFMDMTPAILIFTPIFLPIVSQLGIDAVHFGIIMITNLSIGLCLPPVGTCLFVGCGIGNSNIGSVSPKLIPYVLGMIFALLAITFIPELSTWLPNIFGLGK